MTSYADAALARQLEAWKEVLTSGVATPTEERIARAAIDCLETRQYLGGLEMAARDYTEKLTEKVDAVEERYRKALREIAQKSHDYAKAGNGQGRVIHSLAMAALHPEG